MRKKYLVPRMKPHMLKVGRILAGSPEPQESKDQNIDKYSEEIETTGWSLN